MQPELFGQESEKKTAEPIDFEEFWKSGPWLRVKRKDAERAFRKTVRTLDDLLEIRSARDAYSAHLDANPWKNPQNGGTWFKNWRDWLEFEEPAPRITEADKRNHIHNARCHEWGCPFDRAREFRR